MTSRSVWISISAVAFLGIFSVVQAQAMPTSAGSIDLSLSTSNPTPGQSMTITAHSYSGDILGSKVTWTENGKVVQSGMGLMTLSLQAPTLGKIISVGVSATTADGQYITGSVDIGAADIDMIMETDGYVPPFFMGKIPLAYQNSLKIVAIPHIAGPSGVEIEPKTLVYQWMKNGEVLQDQSGYGKQSLTMVGDLVPRPYEISVTATSRNSTAKGSAHISVEASSPSISFYSNDPLYGPLYNSSANSFTIGSTKEAGVLAVPFGVSYNGDVKTLDWQWYLNNQEQTGLSSSRSITLRAPEGTAGTSNILLEIDNPSRPLEVAKGSFSVSFTASSASTPVTF